LSAVQLLWVNLIMDTFAALALATDPPTENILHRKPVPKSASLFTVIMWKMIIGQAIYQLAVTFMLYFAGDKLLGSSLGTDNRQLKLDTIVFNTFVWMQIFNEFNNRRLDNRLNIFEGMFRNYWFLGINCIMVGGQIMIIYVGGAAFGVTRLDAVQWGICIVCAIACLPWAVVLRLTPDRPVEIIINFFVLVVGTALRPVGKAFSAISRTVSSMMRPVKRFSRRVLRRNAEEDDSATEKEEAPLTDVEKQHTPKAPATPVVVPPITITSS
jgi:Ca2+-transporting ATPase